jgi:HEAT repeat protein
MTAAATLGVIGDPSAMPAIAPLLKDESRFVRRSVALALERMGLFAQDAVPSLEGAVRDADPTLQE